MWERRYWITPFREIRSNEMTNALIARIEWIPKALITLQGLFMQLGLSWMPYWDAHHKQLGESPFSSPGRSSSFDIFRPSKWGRNTERYSRSYVAIRLNVLGGIIWMSGVSYEREAHQYNETNATDSIAQDENWKWKSSGLKGRRNYLA